MSSYDSTRPRFSIVTPIHGVERYIADAVADILVQHFGDFELILVDDCSPDRSIEVAQAVAGDDPRVRTIAHERNRGVSAARNTGIDAARGEWILFLDPDDRYSAHLLECVNHATKREEPDLIIFGHVQEYYAANGSFLYDNPIDLEQGNWSSKAELGSIALQLEKQTHLGYVWNKAYRADVIRDHNLRFEDDVPLIEDILFNVAYLYHVDSIACISDSLYRYAKRLDANLTNEFYPVYYPMHRRRILAIRDFLDWCGALDATAKSTLGALYARFIMSSIEQNTSKLSGMDLCLLADKFLGRQK